MFTLYRQLPLSVRPTYYYNLRAAIFNGVAMGTGQLFHTIATKILGASSWQLAIIDGLTGVGMFAAFFLGALVTGRRKMPFVLWPQVCCFAGYLLLGFVAGPLWFCLLAGGMLLAAQTGIPAMAGMMRQNLPARLRGRVMGFTRRWFFLTALIVTLVGSELITREETAWTWRLILPLGGVAALISGLLWYRIRVRGERRIEDRQAPPFRPFAPFRFLLEDRDFRHYTTAFFIFGFANLMMRPILPVVLKEDMGADFRQMQWAWSIAPTACTILTVGLWGRLVDRKNPLALRATMNLVWAIMPLAVFLAPPMLPMEVNPVWLVCAGRLLQGLVMGGSMLLWHLGIMYFAKKEDVPAYMAVHIGMTGVRISLAPWISTLLVELMGGDSDARAMLFLIVAMLMVYAGTLMLRLSHRIRKTHGGQMPSFAEREEAEDG